MKKHNYHTDFLFSDSNFLTGVGSVLNIQGSYFEFAKSNSEREADIKALRSDWNMVGQDIEGAMEEENANSIIDSDLQLCEK